MPIQYWIPFVSQYKQFKMYRKSCVSGFQTKNDANDVTM